MNDKKPTPWLPDLTVLTGAAGVALVAGLILTAISLANLPRTLEIWRKKSADLKQLQALQARAVSQQRLVATFEQLGHAPVSVEDLTRSTPGMPPASIRNTEIAATIPGWKAKRVGIGFTDLPGDKLGTLLGSCASARPPWSLLECTLFASPEKGRLSKVELVLGTVERE